VRIHCSLFVLNIGNAQMRKNDSLLLPSSSVCNALTLDAPLKPSPPIRPEDEAPQVFTFLFSERIGKDALRTRRASHDKLLAPRQAVIWYIGQKAPAASAPSSRFRGEN